ncbi:MAG: hypothetical protein HYS63_07165 [Methylocystis sp.]|nr:hypothetical protein [Methylocystis sp.]
MNQRSCANGILAAVLSANFLPIHGALAKEERPATPGGAKHAAKKPAAKHDANKPSPEGDAEGAGDKQ